MEIGGSQVEVSICHPAIAVTDGLDADACALLGTVDRLSTETGVKIQ